MLDLRTSSPKPSKIHEAKIMVALIKLAGIIMCARNLT